ncbi:MAG: adenylate/guanylate cyclase domain-containing protein [Ferruginibacter sp.]
MNVQDKHIVEFIGDGFVKVAPDTSLLEASLSAGIRHMHVCGGKGQCSTCRVLVLESGELLSAPTEKEKILNSQMNFDLNVRLACQTRVKGESVKLKRIIQDESDIKLYVGKTAELSSNQIGEEVELVLFFFDIRNFTDFTQSHLAFDVIHIVRKLFSNFHAIIQKNNGEIIETMGDGFYAIFGCEKGNTAGVQAAIDAAVEILKDMERLNKNYFVPYFNEIIEVGIGVHIGKVISGKIRLGTVERSFAMGLPVNIAARLQNATKELNNNFLVSAEACNYLPVTSKLYPSTSVKLKGITDEVNVFLFGKSFLNKS